MSQIASRGQLRMSFLRYALVTVPAILLLGTISGRASGSGYGNPWFDALIKPSIIPPSWVFGVAWTILYILLGLVLAMILHAHGARRRLLVGLFIFQLALNFAWSPLFFAWHEVGWALALIVAMLAVTAALIVLLCRIRPAAAWLMMPYAAWLVFAGLLTWQVDTLNPDARDLVPGSVGTDIELEL